MQQLLWYLFVGTRGGLNRLRIVEALNDRPYNAHQLSELLGLDYRTTRHHLRIMLDNHLVANPTPTSYGSLYFLGGLIQEEGETMAKICEALASPNVAKHTRGAQRNLQRGRPHPAA
jgi:Bacterial regulatory protein, arsR family